MIMPQDDHLHFPADRLLGELSMEVSISAIGLLPNWMIRSPSSSPAREAGLAGSTPVIRTADSMGRL